MRPRGVSILVATMILATVTFGIGAGLERANASTAMPVVQEAPGSTSGESTGAEQNSAPSSEVVLGLNPESTPLVVGALVGSLALAAAVWFYWRRQTIFWVAGAAMAGFAGLDLVEFVHQISERHPTLVIVAGIVAILHATAAFLAIRLAIAGLPVLRHSV